MYTSKSTQRSIRIWSFGTFRWYLGTFCGEDKLFSVKSEKFASDIPPLKNFKTPKSIDAGSKCSIACDWGDETTGQMCEGVVVVTSIDDPMACIDGEIRNRFKTVNLTSSLLSIRECIDLRFTCIDGVLMVRCLALKYLYRYHPFFLDAIQSKREDLLQIASLRFVRCGALQLQ